MSEEYNNQKTEQSIGQLYPVLVSKDGKVLTPDLCNGAEFSLMRALNIKEK